VAPAVVVRKCRRLINFSIGLPCILPGYQNL
jgi:hypothetical protein